MTLPIYQVDAFTNQLFGGNPAAVCPLEEWLPEKTMQQIGMENNLSETAFFVKNEGKFEIRWFTPAVEVALCGHATLAAAHVIFNYLNFEGNEIEFSSKSGPLFVRKNGDLLTLDFPAAEMKEIEISKAIIDGLGKKPTMLLKSFDHLAVFETEKEIREISPDFAQLAALKEVRGIIATASGEKSDFVSRFFAPQSGVDEDPVTGSAHTILAPFWGKRLNKTEMTAVQLSERVGHLRCKLKGDRVEISGNAVTYLKGRIQI